MVADDSGYTNAEIRRLHYELTEGLRAVQHSVADVKTDVASVRGELRGAREELSSEIRDVAANQRITNGNVSALQLWRARMEGARVMTGSGMWPVLLALLGLFAGASGWVAVLIGMSK